MSTASAFRQALELSQAMRAAAQQGEWDRLVMLEAKRQCALATIPPSAVQNDAAYRAIAQEILQADRETLELAGPYMDQLRPWITHLVPADTGNG